VDIKKHKTILNLNTHAVFILALNLKRTPSNEGLKMKDPYDGSFDIYNQNHQCEKVVTVRKKEAIY
jgi:hypothetical protein